MTSILLSIMSVTAILIIPREAEMQVTDISYSNSPMPLAREKCPSIETKDFDVIAYDQDSKDESCATLEVEIHRSSDPELTFFMIFGRLNHMGGRLCIFDNDLPVIMFTCTKQSPSASDDPKTRSLYMKIYGRVIEPAIGYDIRCALYKNDGGIVNKMAISPNKSCDGLADILSNPQSSFPKGYVLLIPNRPRYIKRRSMGQESLNEK